MAIQPVEQGSAFAFRNVINNNFYELKVLSGASKPTQSTAAVVGQMYLDTSEGKMYFCSNVSGSVYTWKPFASDMSASNVGYNNGSSGMSSDNVQDAIDELFTSASNGKELIADAIAGKGVPTSANDTYATMAGNIEKIETGIDISDATLTAASELKKDIVAYSKTGKRIVGNLGNGSVGAPSISISVTENNSKAEIKATTSYTSGIIGTNSTSSVKSLNVQQGTTITPGTSEITAVTTGKYTTGPVYVAGDSNLNGNYIKRGVSIFGVSGFYDYNQVWVNNMFTQIGTGSSQTLRINLNKSFSGSEGIRGFIKFSLQDTYETGVVIIIEGLSYGISDIHNVSILYTGSPTFYGVRGQLHSTYIDLDIGDMLNNFYINPETYRFLDDFLVKYN